MVSNVILTKSWLKYYAQKLIQKYSDFLNTKIFFKIQNYYTEILNKFQFFASLVVKV